ncbi:right-handed parallel beta-helix repeat-containing protein [Streptomyces sp. NPDC005318]|uniref:right-handed parallel beta-helix repeat-containing protein n=1 Tax=Streptomyces sp. NPDC005318 TaxID=3157031 RepID=UPI0033B26A32
MKKRSYKQLICLAAVSTAAVGVTVPACTAASSGSKASSGSADSPVVREVHAGKSIQAAVDAARPGDTIVVKPGTYHESVLITKARLTLRGTPDRTVIMPAAAGTKAANACAKAGNGICVQGKKGHTVDGVRLESLTVSGFKKNGVWATWTDKLSVRKVTSRSNGIWGIAQERSTRGQFRDNTARANGDAGIFVANTVSEEGGATDTRGTEVRDNTMTDNRIGLTVRRLRNLSIHDNTLTGNCSGVFVVGDEGKPQAGAMTIQRNRVTKNNKFCVKTERLPAIQGSGIILTGTVDTIVRSNTVDNNVGATPLSGGIVLFKSFVGAHNTGNTVSDNRASGNRPADLTNQESGNGNKFTGNVCATSVPAGMC